MPSYPERRIDVQATEAGERDGELFRSFLPEEFDEITFEGLVEIALRGKDSPAHDLLVAGAIEFHTEIKSRVLGEIASRKGVN